MAYAHYVFFVLRVLLPALSCVQTCLLHLLDMSWEAEDLSLFLDIKLPDLLFTMSQENISVHDIAIRYEQCFRNQNPYALLGSALDRSRVVVLSIFNLNSTFFVIAEDSGFRILK